MKAPWNPQSGFQVLKARSIDAITVASFAEAPISPNNVLNILLAVMLVTSVFQLKYSQWHTLPTNGRTILNALD